MVTLLPVMSNFVFIKDIKKNIWEFQMSLLDDLKFPNMILNKWSR